MKRIACAICLFALLLGCREFRGDGKYKRYSYDQGSYLYEVDFGPIDLRAVRTYTFSFSGVPSSRYWLCLRTGPIAVPWEKAAPPFQTNAGLPFNDVQVDVSLRDSENHVLSSCAGVLTDPCWHWSAMGLGNFPAPGKGMAPHYILLYPSGGQMFQMSSRRRYTVVFKVVNPTLSEIPKSELLLQGGFWK
jgi:hypothetical protein